MPFAHEKLNGLNRDGILAVVEPVLAAHGVEGVELIWRTDHRGWLLYVTVERLGSAVPGAGVSLDDCSELSRDLSAAFDVADSIPGAYRLEVGTPGVERNLYRLEDFQRFRGQIARLKCHEPVEGNFTLRGALRGLDTEQRILLDTDSGTHTLDFEQVETAHLVLDMTASGTKKSKGKSPARR